MPDPLTIPMPRPWTAGPLEIRPDTDEYGTQYAIVDPRVPEPNDIAGVVEFADALLFTASPDLFEGLAGLLSDEHRDDLELIRSASTRAVRATYAQIADAIARIDQREQAGRDALRKALGQEAKGA